MRVLELRQCRRRVSPGDVVPSLRVVDRDSGIGDLPGEEWSAPAGRAGSGSLGVPAVALGLREVGLGGVEWLKVGLGPPLHFAQASFGSGERLVRVDVLRSWCLLQLTAAGDGGLVGAVVGQRLFEHVSGAVGVVGDDEELVVGPTAGGRRRGCGGWCRP